MPKALFLSPHLDDVAFSCGGAFRALSMRGWETTLCTIFTRSVANPTGFALACQLDKGLGPHIDYLAIRHIEDDAAVAALGATGVERLDLAEAPHRGYDSATALFGAFVAGDDVGAELDAHLAPRLGRYDLVFVPQALGNHVDHRRVRDSVLRISGTRSLAERIVWYRDAPYVIRDPGALPGAGIAIAFPATFAFALDVAALGAKLDACAAYRSQLRFQFGSEASMRDALREFARTEGLRFGSRAPSEGFRAASGHAGFLSARPALGSRGVRRLPNRTVDES